MCGTIETQLYKLSLSVIDNDYVLSLMERYNEGSDDDNDYDNDGNDTNLNNDGSVGGDDDDDDVVILLERQ